MVRVLRPPMIADAGALRLLPLSIPCAGREVLRAAVAWAFGVGPEGPCVDGRGGSATSALRPPSLHSPGRELVELSRGLLGMRPNWFFAFPVDGRFIEALPPPPPSFRLFPCDDVHLTLAFLGTCGEGAALRALNALDALTANELPVAVDVSLGRVAPMGPKHRYSALSALLEQGRSAAAERITGLGGVLRQAALGVREQRPAEPHVTIARPGRRATDESRRAGLVWAGGLDLRSIVARLDRIALYTWAEGDRRERLFRVVATRTLPAAADSA